MSDMQIDPAELRDGARRLLEKEVDRQAPYAEAGVDNSAELRAKMAELGWMLLTIPAEQDGLGQDFVALAPIYQELGRALSPVSLAGTLAAVELLGADNADLLAQLGTGEAVVALAEQGDVRIADGRATGRLSTVLDTRGATHLLLLGEQASLVDLSNGATLTTVSLWDRSRSAADIAFDGAPVVALPGDPALARAHYDLAIACDSLGGADRALEEAIAYMGTRQQFGRPIGSFQALKHRSADLKVGNEIARAFLDEACRAFATRREGWLAIAAQAKLLASDAYRNVAEDSVQFHGGIGFTWEHDCHLFLKRALLNEMIGGTPEDYRDRIAPDIIRRAFAGRQAA